MPLVLRFNSSNVTFTNAKQFDKLIQFIERLIEFIKLFRLYVRFDWSTSVFL